MRRFGYCIRVRTFDKNIVDKNMEGQYSEILSRQTPTSPAIHLFVTNLFCLSAFPSASFCQCAERNAISCDVDPLKALKIRMIQEPTQM